MNNNKTIADWNKYFTSKNVDEEAKLSYLKYISTLIDNNVPVIFEIDHLSLLLGIDSVEIRKIINSANSFYRGFQIPKRLGGYRNISVPYPTLLYIQRWIKTNILDKEKLSECANGFVNEKSIITNASIHIGNKNILKMDISNFFPSISVDRVISIFKKFGYSKKVSIYLSALCTLKNQLPQGAATSPVISNIISKKFDHRLEMLSKASFLNYSRYADDLTFSGEFISPKIIPTIKKILLEEGFFTNDKKTKIITGSGKKIVTGISIASNSLKLPKATKRELRQLGYFISHYPERYKKEFRQDPFYIDRLIGRYNFWLQVEPDNKFAKITIKDLKKISNSISNFI